MWGWLIDTWRWLVAPFVPTLRTPPSPALAAFLAGQSVRQATYLNQALDPALIDAPDWPAAIRITEWLIRAHITEQERTIAELEAECRTLEAEHTRLAEALLMTQGAEQ